MSTDLTQAAAVAALAYIDQVVQDLAGNTRGTRELDEAVARALGWQIKDFANLKFARRSDEDWKLLPYHTSTFEDAVFHLPRDREFMLTNEGRLFGAGLTNPGQTCAYILRRFHTPALALWAAILEDHASRLKAQAEGAEADGAEA